MPNFELVNAVGDAATTSGRLVDVPVTVYCWGTFDGATVELLIGPSEDLIMFQLHTFTAMGFFHVEGTVAPSWFRARILNAGPNTSLNLRVVGTYT